MKDKGGSNSGSDSDDFDLQEWRESKMRTQEIVSHELEKKGSDLDGKKTVKYRQDPVMNSIYQKILRESDKFEDEIEETAEDRKDIYEYNPHIICGKLTNIRKCSQSEKQEFCLADEGECHAMDLTENIVVVLVGKVGEQPIEGINANLYVPREFYEFIGKETIESPPERLIRLKGNRFVVWIKRELNNNKSLNILDYPYLILDPLNLLYPTYLSSWIDCKRLISLNNYIQGEKEVNEALVFGSTCHRLLEWLAEKVVTVEEYRQNRKAVLERLYDSMLYDMFLIGRTYQQFADTCEIRLDNLVKFYQKHILKSQQLQVEKFKKIYLKIEKIISSQYMFRSNFFGLKGKVDLLLSGQLIDRRTGKSESVFIPMQLKTGKKVSDSHKRQTDIYNILVREKYKKNVIGLLYYSDSDIKFFRYEDPLSAFEIIVVHRNQIAQNIVRLYQNNTIKLPKFYYGFSQCNFCSNSSICELSYHEIQQRDKDAIIQQVPSKYHKTLMPTNLKYSRRQIQYIAKWFKMIHLEQIYFKKINKDYWKMGISNFILSCHQLQNFKVKQSKIRLQLYHHCKSEQELLIFEDYYKISMKIRIIMNPLNLIQGCKIISTSIDNHKKTFTIVIEMNNLQIQFSRNKLNFFIQEEHDIDVDIETFQNSFFAVMRNTVLNLIHSDNRFKDLLINQKKDAIQIDSDEDYSIENKEFIIKEDQYQGFNSDQRKAFKKAVLEDRFCLIEGMPGTGKTQLIIRLIEKFNKMNKTILVTTFTNRSLDNILERLIDSGKIDKDIVIRQGAQYSCSKALKQYSSHGKKFKNLEAYQQFYGKKIIWFVTLSSLYIHHLPKMFDVVILDEASQCLEPTCIEGLLKSRKFILIGDYKQLQPVIKSKQAYKKGMCQSLFQRLCKLYPENTVSLKKQYRMNNKIMTLSNKLVYDGDLELATQSIREKIIKLPNLWNKKIPQSFIDIIQPQNSIVFINYDPIIDSITKKYKQKQGMIRKIIQTELSSFIFRCFIELQVPFSSISVIAAMNSSVNKIVQLLKQSKVLQDNFGTILTIDKSQGIDKQIIILLIQRGNADLIENPRRLNVALTRAKSKLIIIASDWHLSKMTIFDGTLGKMLKQYQVELNKAMIQDMMNIIGSFDK